MASIDVAATADASTVPMGFIPVRIMPGMTTLTPIGAPTATRSARNTSDSPRTPCLATVYGPSRSDGEDRRHRCGVHDVALLAGGEDERHEGVHPVDHAPQVHVDDAVPLLERELPRPSAVDDAGVVHRDVQRSVAVDGGAAEPIDRVGIAHVGGDRVTRRHRPRLSRAAWDRPRPRRRRP